MQYKLYITHRKFGEKIKFKGEPLLSTSRFDVSSLASQIEHFTTFNDQPGKLSFVLEKDPNNILQIYVGDMVEFIVEDKMKIYNVFRGYIFTLGTDSTEAYKVTAYDQTRYLKNHDVFIINATNTYTINTLFDAICLNNDIKLSKSLATNDTQLPNKLYLDSSYFDILKDNINYILQTDDEYFFIKDNFGVLELNELSNCKTNIIIGDESLLTDYKYEVDIDKDTYNSVRVVSSDTNNANVEDLRFDKSSQNRYGILRKIINIGNQTRQGYHTLRAMEFIRQHKDPTKTISLNAIGVPELNAGNGFKLRLKKLDIDIDMWITSATHHYDSNNHTMELEVSGLVMREDDLHMLSVLQHRYDKYFEE